MMAGVLCPALSDAELKALRTELSEERRRRAEAEAHRDGVLEELRRLHVRLAVVAMVG